MSRNTSTIVAFISRCAVRLWRWLVYWPLVVWAGCLYLMWLAIGYFTAVGACLLAPGLLTFFIIEGAFFAIKLAEPVLKRFGINFALSNSLEQSIEGAAAGMVLVLTIGIFAFWLRSKFRILYQSSWPMTHPPSPSWPCFTRPSTPCFLGVGAMSHSPGYLVLYSAVEIGVGNFIGLFAVSGYSGIVTLGEHSKVIFSLLGGVYIVVRGLDNFNKSLTRDMASRHVFDKYLLLKR